MVPDPQRAKLDYQGPFWFVKERSGGFMQQILINDMSEDKFVGGIRLDDGSLILLDTGDVISKDDKDNYEVVKVCKSWVSLSDAILAGHERR